MCWYYTHCGQIQESSLVTSLKSSIRYHNFQGVHMCSNMNEHMLPPPPPTYIFEGGGGKESFSFSIRTLFKVVFAFHLHQRSSKVVWSPRQHCTQLWYCRPHSLFLLLGICFFLALLWLWPCWMLPLSKPKESVKIFFIPNQMWWQHLTVIWLTHLLNQMKKETIIYDKCLVFACCDAL